MIGTIQSAKIVKVVTLHCKKLSKQRLISIEVSQVSCREMCQFREYPPIYQINLALGSDIPYHAIDFQHFIVGLVDVVSPLT